MDYPPVDKKQFASYQDESVKNPQYLSILVEMNYIKCSRPRN